MLRDITAILTAVAMGLATLWYCYLVLVRRIRPAFTHWLVLNTAMCLAFATYWTAPKHSIVGNIGNFVGVFSTNLNMFCVLWARWRDDELRYEFTPFQRKSLAFAGGIVVLWFILRFAVGTGVAGIVTNVLTQAIMVVGYVMLIQRLLVTKHHTESLVVWAAICASTTFAIFPAVIPELDPLGLLYAVRGTVTSGPVVWIIARPEHAQRVFARIGGFFTNLRTSLAELLT